MTFVVHSVTFMSLLKSHIRAVSWEIVEGRRIPYLDDNLIIIDDAAPRNELVEALVENLSRAEYT